MTKEYNWYRVIAYFSGCGIMGYIFARVYELDPLLTVLGFLAYLLVLMDIDDKEKCK